MTPARPRELEEDAARLENLANVELVHPATLDTMSVRLFTDLRETYRRAASTLRAHAALLATLDKAEAWLVDNAFSDIEANGDAIECRTHLLVASGPTLLAALAALPKGKP